MAAFGKHLELVRWVTSNGGYCHENIQVAHDSDRGYHLRLKAGGNILNSTSLLRCSMDCVLTVLNALDSPPFSSHGSHFPEQFLHTQPANVIQYFFLMEQKVLGDKSWWAPYINTLEDPESLPEFVPFEQEDLIWINGTNLQAALKAEFERWRTMFDDGMTLLKKWEWPSAVQGLYTWKLFVWAAKQFDSRSFTPTLLGDTLPAEKATAMGKALPDHELLARMFQEGFSILIPLLDLTSHQPLYEVDWNHNMHNIGITSRQDLADEVEICNNYGPKDNETLLLAYGFVIQDNPFDIVLINLKAPTNSPLEVARKIWRQRKLDREGPGQLYITNLAHPNTKRAANRQEAIFSPSLLSSISVLVANERELRSSPFQREQTSLPPSPEASPLDWQRNLVAVYAQLALECRARLGLLVSHDPSRSNLSPTNAAQTYANIYRKSQQSILESAYHLCCFELSRASNSNENAILIIKQQMNLLETSEKVEAKVLDFINQKTNSLVPEKVMLNIEDVASYLDQPTIQGLDEALEEIKMEHFEDEENIPLRLMEKIRFTVFIAYLDLRNGSDPNSIPNRLKAWLSQLDKWYPTTQEDLMLPTDELLPLLEPLLNVLPDDLWSQELICWAWSVMEEETVLVPKSTEKQKDSGSEMELLLYVPDI